MVNLPVGAPVRITASGLIAGGTALSNLPNAANADPVQSVILGVIVASSTSGTIKLTNVTAGAAGSTILLNTTASLTGGTYLPLNISYGGAVFCTVGGTIDCTFIVVS